VAELDALDPQPEQVKLSTGTLIQIEDLRSRQFFKFLRIITHGALPLMQDMSLFQLDPNTDAREFSGKLMSIMLLSIPDAEDETIEFVRSMCRPVGLIEGRKLNKQDTERNTELWFKLELDLDNPELDDLVTIIEAIVRREASDIQALGKRLAAMFKLAEKTGQLSPTPSSPTPTSSEDSAEPSTSSPPSTDGPTTSSVTSPSGDSANASPPSGNGASTPSGSGSNG